MRMEKKTINLSLPIGIFDFKIFETIFMNRLNNMLRKNNQLR